tara:strand:- start:711 stop:1169 length:459 start_codon:yes stop_codon:yes gene_type:complete
MKRILAHHYDPRRSEWEVDLPVGYASQKKSIPTNLRGYDLLDEIRPELGRAFQTYGACIHCHEVGDMLNMEALDSGTFTLEQFTGMGPNPADRPVYATGLRPNMEIVAINGMDSDMETRKLIAWFRLNHKPGETVTYKIRGGKEFTYVLPEK